MPNRYQPDILSCLANLSSDEVFTPPEIANQMLDMLPQELFQSTETTFLDPCSKTGVFLREITKRLLEAQIPGYTVKTADINQKRENNIELSMQDARFEEHLQDVLNHILTKQVFGIAITELTSLLTRRSLYCSKYASEKYSVCTEFQNDEGNIRFRSMKHTWKDGKCIYCGASKNQFDRPNEMEQHAYEFIHTEHIEEMMKNMKFDVIIGNPPYQLSVGIIKENYAVPIYQKFVVQAKKLNPHFLTMIIPSRWFTGGRGLDDFRKEMLNDDRIRNIVDYPNPYDCFAGVDVSGGVCYFLWDRDTHGKCKFTTKVHGNIYVTTRILNEHRIFIRDSVGLDIVNRIISRKINNGKMLDESVSPQTPYGIITSYIPKKKGIPCWFRQKVGLKFVDRNDVSDITHSLNKFKLLIPEAPIAGQTDFTKPVGLYYKGNTIIAKPGECCTQTWLVAKSFMTERETQNFQSYLLTKTVRFLILQAVISQHVSRDKFCFVPDLGTYDHQFSDDELTERWKISDKEWNYINSRIHNYGFNESGDEDAK